MIRGAREFFKRTFVVLALGLVMLALMGCAKPSQRVPSPSRSSMAGTPIRSSRRTRAGGVSAPTTSARRHTIWPRIAGTRT
jgi:hypothetical protein